MDQDPATVEPVIRGRWDAGDFDGAMTVAVEAYGDRLYGFLVGLTGDHDKASDVFSATCEQAWKALPKFRWASTCRVWLYTIARNEFLSGVPRDRKRAPLSDVAEAAIAKVRTTTPPYLRTGIKDRFARLREELSPDDHMLLGLRIDQRMSWIDIAKVLGSGVEAELKRDAATMRKRFARLKARLEALASDLLGEDDAG